MTDDVTCPALDRPERYEHVPQVGFNQTATKLLKQIIVYIERRNSVLLKVVCKEAILGIRAYWEVRYSGRWWSESPMRERGQRRLLRPGGEWPVLGSRVGGSYYQVWSDGISKEIYDITFTRWEDAEGDGGEGAKKDQQVKLLQRVRSSFKGRMLAGFWLGQKSSCSLVKLDE